MVLIPLISLALSFLPAASAYASGGAQTQLQSAEALSSMAALSGSPEGAYAHGRGTFDGGPGGAVAVPNVAGPGTGSSAALPDPGPTARDKAEVPPPGEGEEKKGFLSKAGDWFGGAGKWIAENKKGVFLSAALGGFWGWAAGAWSAGAIGAGAAVAGAAMGALGGVAAAYFFSKGNVLGGAATLGGTAVGFALGGPVGAILGGAIGAGIGWLLG